MSHRFGLFGHMLATKCPGIDTGAKQPAKLQEPPSPISLFLPSFSSSSLPSSPSSFPYMHVVESGSPILPFFLPLFLPPPPPPPPSLPPSWGVWVFLPSSLPSLPPPVLSPPPPLLPEFPFLFPFPLSPLSPPLLSSLKVRRDRWGKEASSFFFPPLSLHFHEIVERRHKMEEGFLFFFLEAETRWWRASES